MRAKTFDTERGGARRSTTASSRAHTADMIARSRAGCPYRRSSLFFPVASFSPARRLKSARSELGQRVAVWSRGHRLSPVVRPLSRYAAGPTELESLSRRWAGTPGRALRIRPSASVLCCSSAVAAPVVRPGGKLRCPWAAAWAFSSLFLSPLLESPHHRRMPHPSRPGWVEQSCPS